MTNELSNIVTNSELSSDEATKLQNVFTPYFDQARQMVEVASKIVVSDVSQTSEMAQARKIRLALKEIRVSVEKERKQLKEESLRKGKAIDGMANVLKFLIEPIEEHLEQQEKFIEIKEMEKRQKIERDRIDVLVSLSVDPSFYSLRDMPDDTFEQLVSQIKESNRIKQETEKAAEAARLAAEKAEAEAREKARIENELLRKEAAEREAELRKEREAKEKLERDIREKAEAEAKAKAKEEADKLEEERRIAKMGDDEKVKSIVIMLKGIILPTVKSAEAKKLISELENDITSMVTKINAF